MSLPLGCFESLLQLFGALGHYIVITLKITYWDLACCSLLLSLNIIVLGVGVSHYLIISHGFD